MYTVRLTPKVLQLPIRSASTGLSVDWWNCAILYVLLSSLRSMISASSLYLAISSQGNSSVAYSQVSLIYALMMLSLIGFHRCGNRLKIQVVVHLALRIFSLLHTSSP